MLDKKVVLVTGSTRGIGSAIASRLLEENYYVIFNGVSNPSLPGELVEKISGYGAKPDVDYTYVQADLAKVDGRNKIMNHVEKVVGRIDVLVNNSGIAPKQRKDILEIAL